MTEQLSIEKHVNQVIRDGLRDAIMKSLSGYNSPMEKFVHAALAEHEADVRKLVNEAVNALVADDEFRRDVIQQIRHKAAKELVAGFGESVFKRSIDKIKADPIVRARCILAIEKIVEGDE